MLSTLPWTPRPEPKPRTFKLSKHRRASLVDSVADILRKGEPTRFAFEGAIRHGLRSSLCSDGWPWALADTAAADVLSRALNRLGAMRPRWIEGQPEFVQFGFSPFERTRCINCGMGLPDENYKFCCRRCRESFNGRRYRQDRLRELAAKAAARRSLTRERATPQACEGCGAVFRPLPGQRFCSHRCGGRAIGEWRK